MRFSRIQRQSSAVVAAEVTLPQTVDYNLHVKPILSDRCFACHGPDKNKQQAGLRLDTPDGAYEALAESGKTPISPGGLKTFLKLPNGIPSHDTVGDIFAKIDPLCFEQCFLDWTLSCCQLTNGEVIAIDGKSLRGSYDRHDKKAAIHMVSAWATTNRLVLGQVKVNDKSNEITAIPHFIKVLAIKGCIATIDTMGCQTDIARLIRKAEADYVLALKGNHQTLHQQVKDSFEREVPTQTLRESTTDHGRVETRDYAVLKRDITSVVSKWLINRGILNG
jgi:predicted transposase YbfD/YdcC